MIRKPPRLLVLALLLWQVVASMGVTIAHAAAPFERHHPAALSGYDAATSTSSAGDVAGCPDHDMAAMGSHDPSSNHSSNHSSKHDCCGSASACECVTAAIPFAAPLLGAAAFSSPVALVDYTDVATAPIVSFFRPPIA